MIPVKLTLRNFMSYGETGGSLSFTGMHVACLSGDNGNGKSALLDAMTWALWGKTRASSVQSVTDDDLIRLGADEAEVQFEFELEERAYRVTRKRRRGKATGSGDWQFAQRLENGLYTSVGGNSQRETGQKITQVLHMEYDTFLNSAYLQQGHADEFTRQRPEKRKQILAEILGLDRYEWLEAKAKERMQERKLSVEELDREIQFLEKQAGRRESYEAELLTARAESEVMQKQTEVQEKHAGELRAKRAELAAQAQKVTEEEQHLQRMRQELNTRLKELVEQEKKVAGIQAILNQSESIKSDFHQLQAARRMREELEPEIEKFNEIKSQKDEIIHAIDMERARLVNEQKLARAELQTCEKAVKELEEFSRQISVLEESLKNEPQIMKEREAAQSEVVLLQDNFARLKARDEEIKTSLHDLEEVLDLLKQPRAACPLCESDLTGDRQAKVIARQNAKLLAFQKEQLEIKTEGVQVRNVLKTQQEATASLSRQAEALVVSRSRMIDLQQLLTERADSKKLLKECQAKVDALDIKISKEDFSQPKRLRLHQFEKDLVRLQDVKTKYESAISRARQLEGADRRHDQLLDAENSHSAEQERQEQLSQIVETRRTEELAQTNKIKELKDGLALFEQIKRETVNAEEELARMTKLLNGSRVTEESLIKSIEECLKADEQRKSRAIQHKKVDEERRIFQALVQSFGKKGIQALIIENAIPELEDEANELLARITDNSMKMQFLTTRNTKAANTEIETLDIHIHDDAGMRPYELYSGGEGFRVNFAIRIALSRLLARRSGAKLETLILDEGFGTQDGKGREKLIEAIEAIKDHFKKILVITHVEELKDSFSQRIEITKDSAGSHIYVM